MESQPQNPEFRINPVNFHPCKYTMAAERISNVYLIVSMKKCSFLMDILP